MNQRIKIEVPWTGRGLELVSADYPDEWVRYTGYADAPALNAGSWAEVERRGRAREVRAAAKRYGQGAEALSAAFVATDAALYYTHPFAQQYYRFEWPAITEMVSGTYGRRDARKARLPAPGTWVVFCFAHQDIPMRVDEAHGQVLPGFRREQIARWAEQRGTNGLRGR